MIQSHLQRPVILLESVSPYGSRRVTVEYDGVVTAAYLHDDGPSEPASQPATLCATWIANHGPAPAAVDEARLDQGQAPLMPASQTRLPGGRAPLDAAALEAVWFEEGDGVAIVENGRPLVVIPGWCDSSRGMPGYSRDAVGQTPFAWSLGDALEGLAPRLERSRAFWRWRQSPDGWGLFQQGVLGHLLARLGPGGQYWEASGGRQPLVGISERSISGCTVLSTVGMSCQRMPVVEQVLDDPAGYARVELAVGTTLPSAQAARVFLWLATYPWQAVTWFGPGHSVRWPGSGAFPLGSSFDGVLLLDAGSLTSLLGPEPPDLDGFTFGGDQVRWLWVVPITENDRQLARSRGSAAVLSRLAAGRRSWICELASRRAQRVSPPAGSAG